MRIEIDQTIEEQRPCAHYRFWICHVLTSVEAVSLRPLRISACSAFKIARLNAESAENSQRTAEKTLSGLVEGQIPLGIDVTLLRTLGLLCVEVPGDVVVVQGHCLNRFIATAAANRH